MHSVSLCFAEENKRKVKHKLFIIGNMSTNPSSTKFISLLCLRNARYSPLFYVLFLLSPLIFHSRTRVSQLRS